MTTEPIHFDELLNAIQSAQLGSNEGFTVTELREHTGIGLERARSLIKAGIKAKQVRVGRKWIERMDGRMTPVPAYVLVGAERTIS